MPTQLCIARSPLEKAGYVRLTTSDQEVRTRQRLEDELRDAVESEELFLLYQPIVDALSGETRGYEALLRWRHPKYGVLSPAVFIEAAEESGSIVEIGKWVLEESCRRAASWDDGLFVAVNVSHVNCFLPNWMCSPH